MSLTKRGIKKLFSGDHKMSLLIDYFSKGTINKGINEVPAGELNGINKIYTLSNTPRLATLQFFLNGVLLRPGIDYTIVGKIITLTVDAPVAGDYPDWILVHYEKI